MYYNKKYFLKSVLSIIAGICVIVVAGTSNLAGHGFLKQDRPGSYLAKSSVL